MEMKELIDSSFQRLSIFV